MNYKDIFFNDPATPEIYTALNTLYLHDALTLSAFEQLRSRFMLLVPVLGCVACAAGAAYLFVTMGRGSSYSALAAAGFGLLQLLISLPKARKAR